MKPPAEGLGGTAQPAAGDFGAVQETQHSDELANEIRGYAKKQIGNAGVQATSQTPPWKR